MTEDEEFSIPDPPERPVFPWEREENESKKEKKVNVRRVIRRAKQQN